MRIVHSAYSTTAAPSCGTGRSLLHPVSHRGWLSERIRCPFSTCNNAAKMQQCAKHTVLYATACTLCTPYQLLALLYGARQSLLHPVSHRGWLWRGCRDSHSKAARLSQPCQAHRAMSTQVCAPCICNACPAIRGRSTTPPPRLPSGVAIGGGSHATRTSRTRCPSSNQHKVRTHRKVPEYQSKGMA